MGQSIKKHDQEASEKSCFFLRAPPPFNLEKIGSRKAKTKQREGPNKVQGLILETAVKKRGMEMIKKSNEHPLSKGILDCN